MPGLGVYDEEMAAGDLRSVAALGDKRLLEPIGIGPGGWADETYFKLALHALKEVTHHGGEIGLLRDLYLREGA